MNFLNNFSIKTKTYFLVSMSVFVAIIFSFLSGSGMRIVDEEVKELILVNNIERQTYRAILEEKNYLLNANGSVTNPLLAKEAFDKANNAIRAIHISLDHVEQAEEDTYADVQHHVKKARKFIKDYEALASRGAILLDMLEEERRSLQQEGENITRQIQEYVEAKRVDIKKKLSQKTVEKINAGSNIWQYTYMTRADEKRYLLSPNEEQFVSFKNDYAFMMSELERLKGISTEPFEFEKLANFHESAKRYYVSMQNWVKHNKEHVSSILPETRVLAQSVIELTLEIADHAVEDIHAKHSRIKEISTVVAILTVVLGVMLGSYVSGSISSSLMNFQEGLLDFFKYLDRRKNSAKQIEIKSKDEIALMASVVNENITKIEEVMEKKLRQIQMKDDQMRKQSRLAQMGEMLSMIAHQWRQPLGAITATTSDMEVRLFKRRLYDLSTSSGQKEMETFTLENLHNINEVVQHLSSTIDDFKDFFTSNKEKSSFRLASLVDKTINLTRHLFASKGIEIVKAYDDDLETLKNYESEVMQVLLNLLHNAAEALMENKTKNACIYISIEKNRVGNQTVIIEDNAGGIDESIISKIFDPYFSTKEKNGTGLGLYMSQMIIEEHCNGHISVRNTTKGACFMLEFLPVREIDDI